MIPHPSQTYVCTAPSVRHRIDAGLAEAYMLLHGASGASNSPSVHDQGSGAASVRR